MTYLAKITITAAAALALMGCATQQTVHQVTAQQQQQVAGVGMAGHLMTVPDPIVLSVVGYGAPGGTAENAAQRRLMALRASEADAYRKLAEQVSGLNIFGDTRVDNYIASHDRLRQRFSTFIQGATITHQEYQDDGVAITHMSLRVSRAELRERLARERYYNTHGYYLIHGDAYPSSMYLPPRP